MQVYIYIGLGWENICEFKYAVPGRWMEVLVYVGWRCKYVCGYKRVGRRCKFACRCKYGGSKINIFLGARRKEVEESKWVYLCASMYVSGNVLDGGGSYYVGVSALDECRYVNRWK